MGSAPTSEGQPLVGAFDGLGGSFRGADEFLDRARNSSGVVFCRSWPPSRTRWNRACGNCSRKRCCWVGVGGERISSSSPSSVSSGILRSATTLIAEMALPGCGCAPACRGRRVRPGLSAPAGAAPRAQVCGLCRTSRPAPTRPVEPRSRTCPPRCHRAARRTSRTAPPPSNADPPRARACRPWPTSRSGQMGTNVPLPGYPRRRTAVWRRSRHRCTRTRHRHPVPDPRRAQRARDGGAGVASRTGVARVAARGVRRDRPGVGRAPQAPRRAGLTGPTWRHGGRALAAVEHAHEVGLAGEPDRGEGHRRAGHSGHRRVGGPGAGHRVEDLAVPPSPPSADAPRGSKTCCTAANRKR